MHRDTHIATEAGKPLAPGDTVKYESSRCVRTHSKKTHGIMRRRMQNSRSAVGCVLATKLQAGLESVKSIHTAGLTYSTRFEHIDSSGLPRSGFLQALQVM